MEPESGAKALGADSKEIEIKQFVMNSYSHLVKDINKGSGDYLNSLLSLLNIKAENKKQVTSQLKSMTQLYTTVYELADEMAKFYRKNK